MQATHIDAGLDDSWKPCFKIFYPRLLLLFISVRKLIYMDFVLLSRARHGANQHDSNQSLSGEMQATINRDSGEARFLRNAIERQPLTATVADWI